MDKNKALDAAMTHLLRRLKMDAPDAENLAKTIERVREVLK